jgi:hypothetical protein
MNMIMYEQSFAIIFPDSTNWCQSAAFSKTNFILFYDVEYERWSLILKIFENKVQRKEILHIQIIEQNL